ncbi:MAG: DUF2290 domain-containing protein [Acidobacteriaceae bacterium]|nr:DUF2290 domain-containing protein [Acidobacteriaceae bacterium]
MIGEGKFRAELSAGFKLLEDLALAAYRNHWPAVDPATTESLRNSASYIDAYNLYLTLQAYDFLLDDGSFFFFRRKPLDQSLLSYGYFECPYRGVSYSDFTSSRGEPGEGAWQDYEEYCAQRPRRLHILPLRYDWSPALYREGAHPASHLHMGYESELRLAVDAVLTPVQFVLIIIRHFYVRTWEATASHLREVVSAIRAISDRDVVPSYRQGRDLLELRLITPRNVSAQAPAQQGRTRHS